MAIKTISKELEVLKRKKLINIEQSNFLFRIATIGYEAFPDLDDGTDRLIAFKKGIELYNRWGVRAFYLEGQSEAFYYQYQWQLFDDKCIEPQKAFDAFSDSEICSLLKREHFV